MCWCHFVICYYFITLRVCTGERGFWFCLSILDPPLCFVRWNRYRTAATGCPEQAFQQLCLWKRMLQVEQDNRMPSSMFCLLKEYHFFVLFCFFKKTKKRERKTLLTSFPFQKNGLSRNWSDWICSSNFHCWSEAAALSAENCWSREWVKRTHWCYRLWKIPA